MNDQNMYNMVVVADDMDRMEKLLNTYKVGLNNWDKSKVFNVGGTDVINYTIVCDARAIESITFALNSEV